MNMAHIRQVGGVGFPSLRSLLDTGSLRVTQAHSCCRSGLKGITGLCRQDSCCWDVSFLSPSAPGISGKHQIPLLSWLKPLRPEGIEMQTRRFSCRSAGRSAFQPRKAPSMMHFIRPRTIKPCCRWPMWASGWIRTKPGYWEGREGWEGVTSWGCHPGERERWPRPLGGSSVSAVAAWGLCASLPVCSRGSAHLQPTVKQLDGLFSDGSALSFTLKYHSLVAQVQESNLLL